jgi:hypothetical protein
MIHPAPDLPPYIYNTASIPVPPPRVADLPSEALPAPVTVWAAPFFIFMKKNDSHTCRSRPHHGCQSDSFIVRPITHTSALTITSQHSQYSETHQFPNHCPTNNLGYFTSHFDNTTPATLTISSRNSQYSQTHDTIPNHFGKRPVFLLPNRGGPSLSSRQARSLLLPLRPSRLCESILRLPAPKVRAGRIVVQQVVRRNAILGGVAGD